MLQWGRAYKSAEFFVGHFEKINILLLQWGRAYKSAELCTQETASFINRIASMGPRLQERGVRAYRACRTCRTCSFNGAALTRARSSLNPPPYAPPVCVASMGPRLQERGVRALEMKPDYPALASMGPRLQERGVKGRIKQCGMPMVSFNGAALTRARSCRLSDQRNRFQASLQWGRAYKSAELIFWFARHRLRLRASMGPRLQERGVKAARAAEKATTLASMGPRLQERGVADRHRRVGHREIASMGPRLQERGVSKQQAAGGKLDGGLQWGRAYKSAELYYVTGLCERAQAGFNGAALTRARSLTRRRGGAVSAAGFNGAALTRARSSVCSVSSGRFLAELQWGRAYKSAEFLCLRGRSRASA